MTNHKRNAMIAWIIFGLILATNLAVIAYYLTRPAGVRPHFPMVFPLVPVLFALVGALITSRHPRNTIGVAMVLPGLSFAFFIDIIAPAHSRPGLHRPPFFPQEIRCRASPGALCRCGSRRSRYGNLVSETGRCDR